jgi:hypothetical protein
VRHEVHHSRFTCRAVHQRSASRPSGLRLCDCVVPAVSFAAHALHRADARQSLALPARTTAARPTTKPPPSSSLPDLSGYTRELATRRQRVSSRSRSAWATPLDAGSSRFAAHACTAFGVASRLQARSPRRSRASRSERPVGYWPAGGCLPAPLRSPAQTRRRTVSAYLVLYNPRATPPCEWKSADERPALV